MPTRLRSATLQTWKHLEWSTTSAQFVSHRCVSGPDHNCIAHPSFRSNVATPLLTGLHTNSSFLPLQLCSSITTSLAHQKCNRILNLHGDLGSSANPSWRHGSFGPGTPSVRNGPLPGLHEPSSDDHDMHGHITGRYMLRLLTYYAVGTSCSCLGQGPRMTCKHRHNGVWQSLWP